jgi:hypothetical protein
MNLNVISSEQMSTSTADDISTETVSPQNDVISSEQMSTSTADDVSTETATTPVDG